MVKAPDFDSGIRRFESFLLSHIQPGGRSLPYLESAMTTLFVCSQGAIRSRTSEVLSLLGDQFARSCGTDDDAVVTLNNELLRNAELIVCFEPEHMDKVGFYMGSEGKEIVCLHIPDVFDPFDEELVKRTIQALRGRSVSAAIETGLGRFKKSSLASGRQTSRVADTFLGL